MDSDIYYTKSGVNHEIIFAYLQPAVKVRCAETMVINPFTSVSHWSGFKVKLTFHGTQFFGSSLYTGQILGILCLQMDLFLIVECIWYNLGYV